jgi:hypothetical protein
MNIKKILSSVTIGAGAIILGLGLQYALAAWTPAPPSPPNCNDPSIPGCNAPINVGSSAQYKSGSIAIGEASMQGSGNMFEVVGKGLFDNLGITNAVIANTVNANTVNANTVNATNTVTNNLQIKGGNPGNNKVLISDLSGNASWIATSSLGLSGGGSSGVSKIIAGTGITVSPSGGTGNVTVSAIPPSGTVGGGCYANTSSSGPYMFSWGNGQNGGRGICICPSNYTSEIIEPSASFGGTAVSLICVAN